MEHVVHHALVIRLAIDVEGRNIAALAAVRSGALARVIEAAVAQAKRVADLMEQRACDDVGALAHVLVRRSQPEAQRNG